MDRDILVLWDGRAEGNTRDYLDRVLRGIPAERIAEFRLRDCSIAPCTGCLACKTGDCVFRDDVAVILEQAEQAETILLATPIYFAGLPAPMKAFADRMQSQFFKIYGSGARPKKETKGLLLSTQGSADRRDCDAMARGAKMLLNTLYCRAPIHIPVLGCDAAQSNLEGAVMDARSALFEMAGVLEHG